MPRKPRMYLPGVAAHVVQRGNNRANCFFCARDYTVYLDALGEALRRYRVQLHAYALMSNHVHLLMTPVDVDGISRVMQHVGRRFVVHVNKAYRRSGTLWEGRHKASLIDAERYLLACYRYIELNPAKAGMVAAPEQYRWSSYRHNACGIRDALVTQHPLYRELGSDDASRRCAYRELFAVRLQDETVAAVRAALERNLPLGDAGFRVSVEARLGRSVGDGKRGRPFARSAQK